MSVKSSFFSQILSTICVCSCELPMFNVRLTERQTP